MQLSGLWNNKQASRAGIEILPSAVADKRGKDSKTAAEHRRSFIQRQLLWDLERETFMRSDGSGVSPLRDITLVIAMNIGNMNEEYKDAYIWILGVVGVDQLQAAIERE